jgi:putative transposase
MPSKFDPAKHHRRSIRLKGYDYSQPGAYFITICTHQRENRFGQVQDGVMQPNRLGKILQHAWHDLPCHYPHVRLGAFCLMPNHVHGIVVLLDDDLRRGGSASVMIDVTPTTRFDRDPGFTHDQIHPNKKPTVRHGLPEIVRAFKSFSARRINAIQCTHGFPVWQRNYYEHIIRNPEEYQMIIDYIQTNPLRWETDIENLNGHR